MAQEYGERWKTVKSLDEGGQAYAYLVQDKNDKCGQKYVLKRLKNIKQIDRFKKEIEAVQKLSHSHIVKLIDFNLETDKPYLVTEYCKGGSLTQAEKFWEGTPLIALDIFQEICEGVSYAHQNGIIHRDLKPDNIFLRSKKGPAVVGDFGICHIEKDGTRITLTNEVVGSRFYTAPESEGGRVRELNRKCDTYSLGKILFWLLSGGRHLPREEYRELEWDLKGKNEDSRLGWNNIYMEHVNRFLLDNMIVADPDKRRNINNILILLKYVRRLIQKEYNPIDKKVPQPCYYCGVGIYEPLPRGTDSNRKIGLSINTTTQIFVCSSCGHVQIFRIDMANRKEWWDTYDKETEMEKEKFQLTPIRAKLKKAFKKLISLYDSFQKVFQIANEELKTGINTASIAGIKNGFVAYENKINYSNCNIKTTFEDLNKGFINPLYQPTRKVKEIIEKEKCSEKLQDKYKLLEDDYFKVAKELNEILDEENINIGDFRYIFRS